VFVASLEKKTAFFQIGNDKKYAMKNSSTSIQDHAVAEGAVNGLAKAARHVGTGMTQLRRGLTELQINCFRVKFF
jgi:hypothetical protein